MMGAALYLGGFEKLLMLFDLGIKAAISYAVYLISLPLPFTFLSVSLAQEWGENGTCMLHVTED